MAMDLKDERFTSQSAEQLLSALKDIKPSSCPPAKQQFKAALAGWSGHVLAFQVSALVTLLMWLMLESLVNTFWPHPALVPIITLLFLPIGMAYLGYVVIAEIGEWKTRESLVHPNRVKQREHDSRDLDKLLRFSPDAGLLKETRIEINAELEKLKNESSAFTGSIKDISSLLLAFVAILAILTTQRPENVRVYPMALAIGSLAVILAFVLKFPVYRRIRLYSHWSHILEKAIHQQTESPRNKTGQ
jgi:hypothetical protein